jgi:AAA domain
MRRPNADDLLWELEDGLGLSGQEHERGSLLWRAVCPVCWHEADGDELRLCIREVYGRGPALIECVAGCDEREIWNALGYPDAADTPISLADGSGAKLEPLDVEWMQTTPPPEQDWLAPSLLARGDVTLLTGSEGCGKSRFIHAVLRAVGYGGVVAGMACKQGRTLVIDGDNKRDEIHRRLYGLDFAPGTLDYIKATGFDLLRDRAWLDAIVAEKRPDAVLLDTLRPLAATFDENNAAEAEAVFRPLTEIARGHNCALVTIHHLGKRAERYRGSTAMGGAVENGVTLTEHTDGHRTWHELAWWKCRSGPKPPPLFFATEHAERSIRLERIEQPRRSARGGRASKADVLAVRFAEILAARGRLTWAELCAAAGVSPGAGTSKEAKALALAARTIAQVARGVYGPPEAAGGTVGPSVGPDPEGGRTDGPTDPANPAGGDA